MKTPMKSPLAINVEDSMTMIADPGSLLMALGDENSLLKRAA